MLVLTLGPSLLPSISGPEGPEGFWPPNFPLHSGEFGLHPDYTYTFQFVRINFQKLHLHFFNFFELEM